MRMASHLIPDIIFTGSTQYIDGIKLPSDASKILTNAFVHPIFLTLEFELYSLYISFQVLTGSNSTFIILFAETQSYKLYISFLF